jgi:hypothetical protein
LGVAVSDGTYRVPGGRCPACGELLDGATQVTGKGAPDKGSTSVCIYCGELLEFKSPTELIVLSRHVLMGLPRDVIEALLRVQGAVRMVKTWN